MKYRTEKTLAGSPKIRKMRRRVAKNLSRPELLKIWLGDVFVSFRRVELVWSACVDILPKE